MRKYTPTERADIMVSELLGSWADNELSPECLDVAQEKCLKPDGVRNFLYRALFVSLFVFFALFIILLFDLFC